MPTYNQNIPQPPDDPSVTQNQFLQNFQTIYNAFGQDHSNFNTTTQGQHMQITFPVGPVTGQPFSYQSGQIGLQSLNQSPTNVPDIWLSRGTAAAYPITGKITSANATYGTQSSGWTYLPSGVLMIWGASTTGAGTSVVIAYNSVTGFPGFSTGANPFVTRIAGGPGSTNFVYISGITLTQFQVNAGGSALTSNYVFNWMAIGY